MDQDRIMRKFYEAHPDLLHVIVPFVPTSENIASWAFDAIDKELGKVYKGRLWLQRVTLWETPNSKAIVTRRHNSSQLHRQD